MNPKCQKCGKELGEDEKFCSNCGEKIEENVQDESNAQKGSGTLIKIGVGALILVACGSWIYKGKPQDLVVPTVSNVEKDFGEEENVIANVENDLAKDENVIAEKEKISQELDPVISCESSYTSMSFGISWDELRGKIDEYLKENYKNMPSITISQWNQNVNTNGTITYTVLLKKDNVTFSDVSVEVDAVSQRPIMFSASFIQSDPTLEPYASSEQKNNLKQIAKMLRVEKEYSDFLLSVEQDTGDAEAFENNVFAYFYNTVDFCNTYVMATTEEKKNEIIDSWYNEELWY